MNESDVVKIALIVGSTRPNRFADVPARWIEQGAAERSDMTLETLDLRDWPMPFFDEPVSPVATGGVWANPETESWRQKIGEFDGFIATAAEYNHGATAVLKNALDSALNEWKDKPISFVGYGGVGGARVARKPSKATIQIAATRGHRIVEGRRTEDGEELGGVNHGDSIGIGGICSGSRINVVRVRKVHVVLDELRRIGRGRQRMLRPSHVEPRDG